ncbi:MAG: prepilin peptidase [Streptosporangiales bacterium]|nr:prepilin peptidase [Streptosporangiales bacterium]
MQVWTAIAAGLVGAAVGLLVNRRIGVRSPAAPAAAGVIFAVLALRFGLDPVLPAYLYLAAVSVALALIDIDQRRLPNALTLPSYVVGLVLLGAAAFLVEDGLRHFGSALAGMAGLWIIYAVLFFLHPRGMGWGDVKLAGVLGLYLGWLGFGAWTVGAVLAFLLGAVYGLVLVVLRRATRKTPIPFGPFMIAGAILAVLFGGRLAPYLGV